MPARLTTLLIDVDGTLLDSNHAHAEAWVRVLHEHGHDVEYDALRSRIGKGGDKVVDEVIGIDEDSDEGKRISKRRSGLFRDEYLETLQPTRGARAFLERLAHDGVQRVVATSAGGDELESLLKQAGVADLIEDASTSADAEASKPDADIVDAALRKAGVDASQAMMLGDTPFDIEAARKAGVDTIALRCGGRWDDEALAGAVAIFDDPAALLAGWDDLMRSRG